MHDKLRCMLIVGNYHILQRYTSIARLTTLSRVQTPVCLQVHLRGHSSLRFIQSLITRPQCSRVVIAWLIL